jgi:uncharacterized membrane protein
MRDVGLDHGRVDPHHARPEAPLPGDFHEARWVVWNIVRVAESLAAFASLAWTLVLDGRSDA